MKKYTWHKIILFLSPKKCILGVDVYAGFLLTKAERSNVFKKFHKALNLIKTYMPVLFSKLTNDINNITVMGLPTYRGQFVNALKMIEVYDEYVLSSDTSTEELASTIVHESQHARLFRLGFGYDEHERERIEMLCRKTERIFGKRIPNGQEVINRANNWLDAETSNQFTDQKFIDNNIDGLRSLNTPEWLIKFILWVSNNKST